VRENVRFDELARDLSKPSGRKNFCKARDRERSRAYYPAIFELRNALYNDVEDNPEAE
jgi:hypothetical protein